MTSEEIDTILARLNGKNQEQDDFWIMAKSIQDLRAENEQLKKCNAIAAEVVPALMDVNRELLSACRSALFVFQAWVLHIDPKNEMAQGESTERDAARSMCALMSAAIKKVTE